MLPYMKFCNKIKKLNPKFNFYYFNIFNLSLCLLILVICFIAYFNFPIIEGVTVDERLDTAETDINTINDMMEELEDDIKAAKSHIRQHPGDDDISDINKRIQNIENVINKLDIKLDINSDINSDESQPPTLGSKLDKLADLRYNNIIKQQ
tara:strand:- start:1994 stop:2446 length:453 start_codon:yes stop_codon:yes gene_type:complete